MSVNYNTTMNRTQPYITGCSSDPSAEKIAKTFAYCLVFAVSLSANTLIGIIVYKTQAMRKTTNFLIVNMAMSDLLLPIFLFPKIITELYAESWLISGPLGQALCKLHVFFSDVSVTVSVQSLVLIAVDRFGVVVFPLRPPLISSKLCLSLIPTTWILAMAIYSPYLFAYRLVQPQDKLICALDWSEVFGESSSFENYILSMFVVFLYTPLVLMTILYSTIVVKLNSQTPPGQQSVKHRQQRMRREQKVLKMAIAIVLGFVVCWVPYSVISLLRIFPWANKTRFSCGIIHLFFVFQFMARANCAINPCICFIFSGNYKQRLKALIRCF